MAPEAPAFINPHVKADPPSYLLTLASFFPAGQEDNNMTIKESDPNHKATALLLRVLLLQSQNP